MQNIKKAHKKHCDKCRESLAQRKDAPKRYECKECGRIYIKEHQEA